MTVSNAPAVVYSPVLDPPNDSPEFVAQKLASLAAETLIDVAVERYGSNGEQWRGAM